MDTVLEELEDRILELEDAIWDCIVKLCEADYGDGTHPEVDEVIETLKEVLG